MASVVGSRRYARAAIASYAGPSCVSRLRRGLLALRARSNRQLRWLSSVLDGRTDGELFVSSRKFATKEVVTTSGVPAKLVTELKDSVPSKLVTELKDCYETVFGGSAGRTLDI